VLAVVLATSAVLFVGQGSSDPDTYMLVATARRGMSSEKICPESMS